MLRTIGTTLGKASGAQKMVCSKKDRWGSCAKADAPSPSEFGAHVPAPLASLPISKSEVRTAPERFPSKICPVPCFHHALIWLR